ncbi:hypothetical protein [Oceanisphaera ostreae]|uniref:Peptidase M4 n=1 Tax=Oceanisphaera ostreae TaxID=914151 RepID=A0ABW3KMT8_9GAMM
MTEQILFGDRLFLPVLMAPYRLGENDPQHRKLWIYVLDPAGIGLKKPTQCVDVLYEPLGEKGIRGALFEVEHAPLPNYLLKHLDWPDRLIQEFENKPLHLDEPRLAMSGGIEPCTGTPLFAGQMAYAVCQRVYESFADALGRYPTWGPWAAHRIRNGEAPTLRIQPFALEEANAYYDADSGTLKFGVFETVPDGSSNLLPGGVVMTTLSHDIIAHEVTHALLDGMRAHFRVNTHPDVPAFHEGFADLVALFQHFRYPSLVEQAIEDHGGLNSDMLLELGREFGEALSGVEGRSLRHAIQQTVLPGQHPINKPLIYTEAPINQPHKRAGILVSAIFSAYLQIYQRRAKELLRLANFATHGEQQRALPSELISLLANEATVIAEEFLKVCIRAIDYCPPLDVRFGDYLRAIITADRMLNKEDGSGMREALIREFRRRNVDLGKVRDLSEYSLEWNSPSPVDRPQIPGLAWSQLRFDNDGITAQSITEVERQAGALDDFLRLQLEQDSHLLSELGLTRINGDFGPITIESLRPVARRARNGRLLHGMVAEISQICSTPDGPVWGGSTLVLTEEGSIEFAIYKRVDNEERLSAQRKNLRLSAGNPHFSFKHGHDSHDSHD